jgi:hypothetical protein
MENSEAATEDNGLEMRYDHLYKSKINHIINNISTHQYQKKQILKK